ncbi:MAG: hypothetical protein B6D61_08710 [Bacteroidetes bacterium 4484_249]|nr:MAG: hypothetical protein B6D61_08710 [Bacteroidetes bacterium 4484_249]
MKKLFISLTFILSVTLLFAQKAEEKELKSLMKELGYSWSETESTRLRVGESAYYWRTFYTGNEYAILTFSEDKRVYDVDLLLYGEDGSLLDKSISGKNFEKIEFSPSDVTQVKIVLNNYDSSPELVEYKCKFMIFYK